MVLVLKGNLSLSQGVGSIATVCRTSRVALMPLPSSAIWTHVAGSIATVCRTSRVALMPHPSSAAGWTHVAGRLQHVGQRSLPQPVASASLMVMAYGPASPAQSADSPWMARFRRAWAGYFHDAWFSGQGGQNR